MKKPSIALLAVVLAFIVLGVGTILGAARETGTLNVISPEENTLVGGSVPVTLSFDTASEIKATHFQVYVDGQLHMTKALDEPATDGTVTISLPTERYSSNQHTVTIKMFAGAAPLRSANLSIYIDNGSADIVAPLVAVISPRYGATLSDKAEISLSISDNAGNPPVVALFIDKALRLIKDHGPYTYVWDTTQYANGEHVIEVRAEDASGNRGFSRSVKVVVNNPTGFTRMRTDGVKAKPAAQSRALPRSVLSAPAGEPFMVAKALEGDSMAEIAPGQRLMAPPETEQIQAGVMESVVPEMAQPTGSVQSAASAIAVDCSSRLSEPQGRMPASSATMRLAWPAPKMVDRALRSGLPTPSSLKAVEPKESPSADRPLLLAKLPKLAAPVVPVAPVKAPSLVPARPGQIHIIQPGESLEGIAHFYGISPKVLEKANNLAGSRSLKAGRQLFIPPSVQVVFDDQSINFDVLPRVRNGKPITPFRQIFEHAGGTLYWLPSAKMVRAISEVREVEIQIGQTRTLVNNEPVEMELAAFIESGRTMVPVTFVRDALDVTMSFNPATGKVVLTSPTKTGKAAE
ncbi:MAG: LysM peptidoglycan-binding domain-containing protein [Armatimonadetes bacterium]|nr:LysM peptidoglycan-binding domain-containing protein [Armatimonadota bacterium]